MQFAYIHGYWLSNMRFLETPTPGMGGGGAPPYVNYIGMCRCEGYGF